MRDPVNLITAEAIGWSLACILVGWAIIFLFEEWKFRDMKRKQYPKAGKPKKYSKEVNRLLDLDETERMIS